MTTVCLRRWQWGELPVYNGFVHAERVRGWQLVDLLVKVGVLSPPLSCAISGATEGIIGYHSECYYSWSPSALAQPIHFALHRRFKRPEQWLRTVERYVETGEEWWANLPMVPTDLAAGCREVKGEQVVDIFSRAPLPVGLHINKHQIYEGS